MAGTTWMRLGNTPDVRRVVVPEGPDAADDWIAEHCGAGDIVVTELDDPTCEAGRSEDPNCMLCEVEVETKRGEVRSVMGIVAVRDIPAGDFITIAPSDSEEDEGDEDDEFDE